MPYVAKAMAEIGDLDGALTLARTLREAWAVQCVPEDHQVLHEEDWRCRARPGRDQNHVGAESMKVKDRTTTRQAMPKIAQAVCDSGDLLFQARMLAMIAHLQAKAGDFAGARQTADSIPTIKRRDFPGPRDGFYDAIKPGVLALIARLQFDTGDKAGASEGLRQAVAMSHAIEAPGQRIVAQIVIAQTTDRVRRPTTMPELSSMKSSHSPSSSPSHCVRAASRCWRKAR